MSMSVAPSPKVPPNKSLQRAGDDDMHAPDRHAIAQDSVSAPKVSRAAAELSR